MMWQRVRIGYKFQSPIAEFISTLRFSNSEHGFGFFSRSCSTNLLEPIDGPLKDRRVLNKIEKAVESFRQSMVTVTLSTGKIEKRYAGTILDPGGYIVTSAHDMVSQRKEDLSKYKAVVHLNPGKPTECTLSGEVSYADLVNKIAIIKCKSEKPLPAAKLNRPNRFPPDLLLLHGSITCGHDYSLSDSLVADLVGIIKHQAHDPIFWNKVDTCIISSSSAPVPAPAPPPAKFGTSIINLDGELVGIVADSVKDYLCATSARVISKVLKIVKEHGNLQPWIGLNLISSKKRFRVCQVVPDSPASDAGLNVGDVLLDMNGSDIRTFAELYNIALLEFDRPLITKVKKTTCGAKKVTITPRLKEQDSTPFI